MKPSQSLIVILLFSFAFCAPTPNHDDLKILADSLTSARSKYHVIAEVRIIGYDVNHFSMMVSAELDYDSIHKNNHAKLLVNQKQMEYSTSTGNYYERKAGFRIDFDENDGIPDSIFFEIAPADTSIIKTPAVSLKIFRDFLNSKDLYKNNDVSRTKPIRIDWGGKLPDGFSVMRTVRINSETGETVERELITHEQRDESYQYEIAAEYFNSAAGRVTGFDITWNKSQTQTVANAAARLFVSIDATVTQSIKLGQ